jgi:translocation and assembly module TamA
LTRRVVADFPRLTDALRANDYYNASVRATVAGVAVSPDGRGAEAAAGAAERHRNASLAPVRFEVVLGPQLHLRKVSVYDVRAHAPIDRTLFNHRAFDLDPEEPARAAALLAREAGWVDGLHAKSFPLAKIVETRPLVLHSEHAVDVDVTIDPGPRGGIGEARLSGSPNIDPQVIRSFIYLEEGEDYSPKKLADTRKSVSRIEAVDGAKVEDASDHLDRNGNMPILVETSERRRNAVGASAMYSNVDGPALRAY